MLGADLLVWWHFTTAAADNVPTFALLWLGQLLMEGAEQVVQIT